MKLALRKVVPAILVADFSNARIPQFLAKTRLRGRVLHNILENNFSLSHIAGVAEEGILSPKKHVVGVVDATEHVLLDCFFAGDPHPAVLVQQSRH